MADNIKAPQTTKDITGFLPITGSPLSGDKFGLDLGPIDGEVTFAGASVSLLVEEVELNDTNWTEITTSKTTRNALNIQNRSEAEDNGAVNVYFRHVGSGTGRMKLVPDGERQYTIGNVAIYGKTAAGTHKVTVEALA